MTLVQASFFSKNLNRQVYYNAMIPTTQQPLRTLYLLHGWSGSHDDWIKRTRVLELAENIISQSFFPMVKIVFMLILVMQNHTVRW